MYCKAQSHNWQLQLNQTGLAICVQVFDWSTTVRKVVVIAENKMSKSKTVLKMTAAGLDAPWETTTPLMCRSCNDGVIQLSPLSLYVGISLRSLWELLRSLRSVMHVLYTLSSSIPTHFSQLDLNPANLEATVEAKMNSGVPLLAKTAFFNDVTITS